MKRYVILILALIAASMGFVSCSDDDGDKESIINQILHKDEYYVKYTYSLSDRNPCVIYRDADGKTVPIHVRNYSICVGPVKYGFEALLQCNRECEDVSTLIEISKNGKVWMPKASYEAKKCNTGFRLNYTIDF